MAIQEYNLIVYYNKLNRYSFNALIGALETQEYFTNLDIQFPKTKNEVFYLLKKAIDLKKRPILAISLASTQIWDIFSFVNEIRSKFGNKIILIGGGPHPTGDPEGTLKSGFDIIIKGEGEETIIDLLINMDIGQDLCSVKGIAFFDENGEFFFTGKRSLVDLNDYPPFAVQHNKFGPIEITRGCPYVCYFCQTPHIFGANIRHRNIEQICHYIEIMKSKNLKDIRFISPNALSYGSKDGKNTDINKLEKLLIEINKKIKPDGRLFFGTFPSEVRPEHVTDETIALIKNYADNDNLIIGAQSGSQKILNLCHRSHSVEDIYQAVNISINAGFKVNADFIFGLPGEDKEDVILTIKMMKNLIKLGVKIHAHTFMPLPQTPFVNKPAGKINKDIQNLIKYNIPKGIIYGDWREQQKIAKKLSVYFKTGKI